MLLLVIGHYIYIYIYRASLALWGACPKLGGSVLGLPAPFLLHGGGLSSTAAFGTFYEL